MTDIYFAEDGERVKIGIARDAKARVRQLNAQSGLALRIIGTVPGDFAQEKALHTVLREYSIRNEWYRNSAELRHIIERCLIDLNEAISNPDGVTTSFAKVARAIWPDDTAGRIAQIADCDLMSAASTPRAPTSGDATSTT